MFPKSVSLKHQITHSQVHCIHHFLISINQLTPRASIIKIQLITDAVLRNPFPNEHYVDEMPVFSSLVYSA
jgi:hypothetical protein